MDIFQGVLNSILKVLADIWWIVLPLILFFPLRDLYLVYVRDRVIKKMNWVLLEIKVPKDILKTPKAMEQVFSAMYASYSHGFSFLWKYFEGEVDDWYSFEMVGHSHGIHFYVFAPANRKPVIESAVYAQYPDAEITEADDYTNLLPKSLPNQSYDLWGTSLILKKESFYPIRTYPYFEEAQEEKRLDPISSIAEAMAGLKENEWIWWQVIVCPSDFTTGNKWKEEGEQKIAELSGQGKKALGPGWLAGFAEWLGALFIAPFRVPEFGVKKEEKQQFYKFLNPAETEMAKAIDNKISKLGFDTTIRWIYIAPAKDFSSARATAVMGSIRQFNTQNLNNIGPDNKELTLISIGNWKAKFIPYYQKWMLLSRKKKLFANYKARRLRGKMVGKFRPTETKISTFNTEELATVYHFPTMLVATPQLRRLESKRGGAPAGLPVVEE